MKHTTLKDDGTRYNAKIDGPTHRLLSALRAEGLIGLVVIREGVAQRAREAGLDVERIARGASGNKKKGEHRDDRGDRGQAQRSRRQPAQRAKS